MPLIATEWSREFTGSLDMTTFAESVTIDVPVAQVWAVLADVGSIADWNPGVKESRSISDSSTGLGAERYCGLGGKTYLKESVVAFEDCQALTMRIDETNLPFKSADVRFTLVPEGSGTRVTVSPIYELKYGPLGQAMDKLMVAKKYRAGMVGLLDGLKRHIEASG